MITLNAWKYKVKGGFSSKEEQESRNRGTQGKDISNFESRIANLKNMKARRRKRQKMNCTFFKA